MKSYLETSRAHRTRGHFKNSQTRRSGFGGFLKWIFHRERASWPKWIESTASAVPAARVSGNEIKITFVNHSTFLIQVDGMNILTDPIWSEWAGPFPHVGSKRIRSPGIRFEDLPVIDAVLVSHNHYDHMDIPTLKALGEKFSPLFVTGLGNKKSLEKKVSGRIEELDWWEKTSLSDGRNVYFVPAQHFSGRAPWNIDKSLWGGFVIESSPGQIYFAGDTGFGEFIERIHERFPDIKVALLPVGAYEPRWFMGAVHLNPDDAVRAHQILKPRISVGNHLGTFHLSDEGIDTPARQLEEAIKRYDVRPEDFIILDFGETVTVAD